MNIKTQIKKEIQAIERYELRQRSAVERLATLALTAATVFSLTGLGHDDLKQQARRDVIGQPTIVTGLAEKNETVRMPIKFDGGLRATATTGS